MKKSFLILAATLLVGVARVLSHGDVELGPNGGRIVEFSTNETMHGEVTLKDGKFRVALLDKDMKPVELTAQTLAVTGGERSAPQRPEVTKEGNAFLFPALKGDSYLLVLQFKESPSAKSIVARFEYDAAICSACKSPEWLCKCGAEENEKEKGHDHGSGAHKH